MHLQHDRCNVSGLGNRENSMPPGTVSRPLVKAITNEQADQLAVASREGHTSIWMKAFLELVNSSVKAIDIELDHPDDFAAVWARHARDGRLIDGHDCSSQVGHAAHTYRPPASNCSARLRTAAAPYIAWDC